MPSVKGNACLYCLNCTKFGQLILRKIIKTIATRCQILKAISAGLCPRPRWGAYSAPPGPWLEFTAGRGNKKGWGKGGEGMEREGKRREGREREGMEQGRAKGDRGNGKDGTGHGMRWGGKQRERRKGREKEERGYSPITSIPGAATANLDPNFVNAGTTPARGVALRAVSRLRARYLFRDGVSGGRSGITFEKLYYTSDHSGNSDSELYGCGNCVLLLGVIDRQTYTALLNRRKESPIVQMLFVRV